jgi:hypothetical protein
MKQTFASLTILNVFLISQLLSCSKGTVSVSSFSGFNGPRLTLINSPESVITPIDRSFTLQGNCDRKSKEIQISLDGGLNWASLVAKPGDDLDYSDETFSFTQPNPYDYFGFTSPPETGNKNIKFRALNKTIVSATSEAELLYGPDPNPAAIAINSDVNGTYINSGNNSTGFTLSGTCNKADQIITLMIDNVNQSTSYTCDGTNFTATIDTNSLDPGDHTVFAAISDSHGTTMVKLTPDSRPIWLFH